MPKNLSGCTSIQASDCALTSTVVVKLFYDLLPSKDSAWDKLRLGCADLRPALN